MSATCWYWPIWYDRNAFSLCSNWKTYS